MYKHVMIDLETLGRRAGCSVLSIGAVPFNEQGLSGQRFYAVISRESCKAYGLAEDEDTLGWWAKQTPEARVVFDQAAAPEALNLMMGLDMLTDFLRATSALPQVRVWGNGSDFDNAILTACYAAIGQDIPWKFWHNRCYRTLKGLDGTKPATRSGTYHNALDDAVTQATHLVEIVKRRGWGLG